MEISGFTLLAGNAGEFAADFSPTHVKVVFGGPVGVVQVRSKPSIPPLLTVLRGNVESTAPGFGTLLTLRLCLPFGETGEGFLRLRGPRSGGRFLTGGSVQIIGVDSADANVHLPVTNLTTSAKNGIEAVMALNHIDVSDPSPSGICNRLDINAVVVAPPIDELQSSIETVLEAAVVVEASDAGFVQIPFKIVKSSASPSYDPILVDNSNISALIPGVYSQVCLVVRTILEGHYRLDIELISKNMRIQNATVDCPKGINATTQLQKFTNKLSLLLHGGVNYREVNQANLIVAEVKVPVTRIGDNLGVLSCETSYDGKWSNATTGFSWPLSEALQSGNPYGLKLSIVHVNTREEVQRPLQSGETVLVLLEFRIPGKSSVNYTPTITIVDSENATLDCPYFELVGKSIFWDENAVDCTTTNAAGLPLLEHSYRFGPAVCEDDTDNEVILGIYMRIKAAPFQSPEALTLKGSVESVEVTKSLLISDETPYKLGLPFLKKDLSLRFSGPYEVEMFPRATQTLQLYFCLHPGIYINNLTFEALSECSFGGEEVITINRISFNRSVNIPGLQFPQSQEQVSTRKASGQIFARKICAGPAYNTGYSYKKKNWLPNATDDCIGINVNFQLTDSEGVYSGAVYPVSVNVIDQTSPNLDVDFHFINVEHKGRGIYLLNLKVTIANDSTLECHDAAIWLMHGGLFDVTVVKVENITMQSDFATLSSGNGISLVEHGGVYFGSSALISLSLRQRLSLKVKGHFDIGVNGMLRCRTYDRSSGLKTQSFEPPTYFQTFARLPNEIRDSITSLSHLQLKLCQVRGCGNVEDLLYESGMDKFWTTYAGSRLDVLFGQSFTVDSLVIRIKSNQNWPTSIRVLTTGDGDLFLFRVEKFLTFSSASLETHVNLNNLPQHRGLRLIIKNTYHEHETLEIKMAFYGTYGLKMKGDFDPCKLLSMGNEERECDEAQPQRSYVAGVDFVIFCDRIPSQIADRHPCSSCFRAFDKSPRLWKYLGPRIAHVVSYIRSENIMIGISCVKESYLMSNDSGESWMFIDRGYFTYLKFYYETIPIVPIPLKKVPNAFEPAITGKQCTSFAFRNWHFCYDGIYHGNTNVLKWNYRPYL
ncbi:hypothetical protein TcWFU_002491 [Taenia crassiceps]|uniref:Uncharacterized protein n=1 Tax=Taenia crassiceps TaxID=6207 RepID=A0ABR4QPB9_9CEST